MAISEKAMAYIDRLAKEYHNTSERNAEKALALRNELWVELFKEYSYAEPDDLNNAFLSCVKNWGGEESFTKYFSFTLNRRKKDRFRKKTVDTVSIYSENDEEEELSVLNQKEYAVYDNYDEVSADYYLSILIDAVRTVNAVYANRKTVNYTRLLFTETVSGFPENDDIPYNDIQPLEDDIIRAVNMSFMNSYKADCCNSLNDIYSVSLKPLSCFTGNSEDVDKSCFHGMPPQLYFEVFYSYIEASDGKQISPGALSQQRTKYNDLRVQIMKNA